MLANQHLVRKNDRSTSSSDFITKLTTLGLFHNFPCENPENLGSDTPYKLCLQWLKIPRIRKMTVPTVYLALCGRMTN
jgi:hypothetical protein